MGQSNSPSENYLFLNVMVNFVIVNQKLTGSALHIEKNQTIKCCINAETADIYNVTVCCKIDMQISNLIVCEMNNIAQ